MDERLVIWSYIIPIIMAIVTGIMALTDAGRAPRRRRMLRLVEMCVMWYFVVSWGLSLGLLLGAEYSEQLTYYIRAGFVARFGMVLVLGWAISDIALCWRSKCRDDNHAA